MEVRSVARRVAAGPYIADDEPWLHAQSFGDVIGVMIEMSVVEDVTTIGVGEIRGNPAGRVLSQPYDFSCDRRDDWRSSRSQDIGCGVNATSVTRCVEGVPQIPRIDTLHGYHEGVAVEVLNVGIRHRSRHRDRPLCRPRPGAGKRDARGNSRQPR